ncbi:hypothetical protein ALC56_10940 [Trachymyrmex septentrionalis]|uniref:Uncharacterized protein n=1 Tax=Trachymyrmex septentrionalis TaxID=34720 RepID=A0A195F1V8_9HYME|nr:hypothetical protein ALC56_10940 [Trachymyrmex septentrionalis]
MANVVVAPTPARGCIVKRVASRQRGRAMVATAREAAVKNISFLSPLSIAHSRYRIYAM